MTGKHSKVNMWLDAHADAKASLYTFSHCITHSDINADKDCKLVILDIGVNSSNAKLKVYKATRLVSEINVINLPSGLVSFYVGNSEPRLPVLAVSSGPDVYIYKNLRPYFKFTMPPENVIPAEAELWGQVKEAVAEADAGGGELELSADAFVEMLNGMRANIGEDCLTECSQHLLSLDKSEWPQFIRENCIAPLRKQSVVSCITTMKKSMPEEDSPSCVVIGTENRHIYILDPEAFTIIEDIIVNAVPASITASGLYDVDYQLFSACRQGCICMATRGAKVAECIISPESLVVGFVIVPPPAPRTNSTNVASKSSSGDDVRVGASIVVALSNQSLHSYSRKGKKHWEISLPCNVKTIISVPLAHLGITLVAVALSSGVVNFYHEKTLVDVLKFNETISALSFGRYGQEDNTLVAVTCSGNLYVKILKRTSCFGQEVAEDGNTISLDKPKVTKFSIPKRTKEYVDQSTRERENSNQIHQTFQRDLLHLRKLVNRYYQDSILKCCNSTSSSDSQKQIKLNTQVTGVGPVFKVILNLETESSDAARDLAVTFHWDPRIYSIDKPFMRVPLLVPKFHHHLETIVRHVSSVPASDKITVLVMEGNAEYKKQRKREPPTASRMDAKVIESRSSSLIITTVINMPIIEGSLMLY